MQKNSSQSFNYQQEKHYLHYFFLSTAKLTENEELSPFCHFKDLLTPKFFFEICLNLCVMALGPKEHLSFWLEGNRDV